MFKSDLSDELLIESNPLFSELLARPTFEPEFANVANADVSFTTFPLTLGAVDNDVMSFLRLSPNSARPLAVV